MNQSAWQLENVRLKPHPTARDQAVATTHLPAGRVVASIPALVSVLLPSQKGRRCDHCLRLQNSERGIALRKCSGCASYWYCGPQCQSAQWRVHHKRMCKGLSAYVASGAYQALAEHERMDAVMLSQMMSAYSLSLASSGAYPSREDEDLFATFLSLIPSPSSPSTPPIHPPVSNLRSPSPAEFYERFANNNFAVHSHLSIIAHGVFPLASRLLNHSCMANAAARYTFVPGQMARMDVVALRDIDEGEQVTIPYLDPALTQTRQQMLELTYGFTCMCSSCLFLRQHAPEITPRPPGEAEDTTERLRLERELQDFVFGSTSSSPSVDGLNRLPTSADIDFAAISRTLLPAFHESYLAALAERFSRLSHTHAHDAKDAEAARRAHESAISTGTALLALYILVYPPNYPQIGMHCVELAKTAWNAVVLLPPSASAEDEKRLEGRVRQYLVHARRVLGIFGPEGDGGGPWDDIGTLEKLLDDK